jgi:cytochrome c-type biogenesis protein
VNGLGALVIAFSGGLVSFLSPCTLPLLPGYVSYISGLGTEEVQERENTRIVMTASGLFVLGFSLIFTSLGATASYIGSLISGHVHFLTQLSGVFIIVMALAMIGTIRAPFLYQDKRFHLTREWGIWSAFPLGMAFAFGWSPCIGPVLTSILGVAMTDSTAQQGALLLFIYALGLGVPFLVFAFFAGRMFGAMGWFRRHYRAINLVGGGVLLVMGAFLVLDRWTELLAPTMRWYANLNLPG